MSPESSSYYNYYMLWVGNLFFLLEHFPSSYVYFCSEIHWTIHIILSQLLPFFWQLYLPECKTSAAYLLSGNGTYVEHFVEGLPNWRPLLYPTQCFCVAYMNILFKIFISAFIVTFTQLPRLRIILYENICVCVFFCFVHIGSGSI